MATLDDDSNRWWSRLLGIVALFVAGLVGVGAFSSGEVRAQGVEESSPADGAELAEPPTLISVTFDNELDGPGELSAVCNDDPFTLPAPTLSADSLTLSTDLAGTIMPQGTCAITYRVSMDDEAATGTFTFSIRQSSVTTPGAVVDTTPAAPSTTVATTTGASADSGSSVSSSGTTESPSSGPIWLGRLLSSLGLAVVFGSFVLIVAAWPEGPEYVVAVRFLRAAWIVALAGTLLYVIAFAAGAKGESFGGGVSPGAWLDLTDAGWPGRAALARLVLTALTGWVVIRPERVIDPTTQLPAIVLPTLATATIGLSRTGGDLAILGVVAGIGHALAMAVWFGSVVLLARVVLAGAGDEDLVHAVRGFGRIASPAIAVTVLTGLIQLYRLDGGALFSTGHGRVLLLKTLAVAFMLFVGMTARQVAQHRLARATDLSASASFQLRRAFGSEAVIGVVVLALSAALLSFTPDKVAVAERIDWAVEEVINDPNSGLELVVRLEPGRVGENRLQVEVVAPESGVSGLSVSFVAPLGTEVDTMTQPIALTGAGIADTSNGDEQWGLPFDIAGAWTLQVDATTEQGAVNSASSSFEIRNVDGSLPESEITPTPTGAPVTAATTTVATTAPEPPTATT
ncbi:MAG: CopD family protein [Desertimonas sp.]